MTVILITLGILLAFAWIAYEVADAGRREAEMEVARLREELAAASIAAYQRRGRR